MNPHKYVWVYMNINLYADFRPVGGIYKPKHSKANLFAFAVH